MDLSSCLSIIALVVSALSAIYIYKQARAMREHNKQTAYRDAMDQLLNIKQAVLDHPDIINDHFIGQELFDLSLPDVIKNNPYYFFIITIFYYRGEQIWTLRKNKILDNDDWGTTSKLMKQYLSVEAYRSVFYKYILIARVHKSGFREAVETLIGSKEEEYSVDRLVANDFPDPLARADNFTL